MKPIRSHAESFVLNICAVVALSACASSATPTPPTAVPLTMRVMMPMPAEPIPAMPIAVSNNAVAATMVGDETRVYSFMGLRAGKTRADIVRSAFEYTAGASEWRPLPDVPVSDGRLASVAVAAGGAIYLFGGYSVADDGHETSTADVLRFDPRSRAYRKAAPMPVPVDDAVALVRADRWIYLVSGWHQDRNVTLVQVYDIREDRWRRANDYPGAPVFGHAGALLDKTMVICDGVRLDVIAGKRTFSASSECWRGAIAADTPERIDWQRIEPHPGPPRYRMGAATDPTRDLLVFAGGSENPYNFDGIGYDGKPSPASDRVDVYDLTRNRWVEVEPLPEASMDHRGLLPLGGRFFLIGGMRDNQRVSADTIMYELQTLEPRPPPPR